MNISTMKWATEDKQNVLILSEAGETISTPYSEESIFWNEVHQFDVANIGAYEHPSIIET